MKFTTTVAAIALCATALSTSEAALSAGCSAYLTKLGDPSNPLAKCRVYTTLGFPALAPRGVHDTSKLQAAVDTYCATPACTPEQYDGVYKDIQTNCAADMVPENQADLGTTMYMWYLSPAQREAVCLKDPTKNTTCVIDSINEMIARKQLPNGNANEDDLYGYIQYVTPMFSAKGTDAKALCTPCNQQVANIFSNHFKKTPSTFPLNFDQKLSSEALNTDLTYQYKTSCKVTLGTDEASFKPVNTTNPAKDGDKDNKDNGAAGSAVFSLGSVVAAAATVAGALAML
ncbi:hypothetical protein BGZ51_006450 [Haplosporangium sp. Z 767]|nr:hypothetical protein BGZ51_006450 [Haplosporangium sp. Z 767]KAF9196579.1 hypothetical protein BGZ50_009094 [Haplosporangium sp. Z 11]